MKTNILVFLLLIGCSTAHAEKVRVYTDYSPIRILRLVSQDADFESEAGKVGLKGNFKVMDEKDIPTDRSDRDAWKLDKGVIKVDQSLKAEINSKKQNKTDLIVKLKGMGLDDSDIEILGVRSE